MTNVNTGVWESSEAWSPRLFFVGFFFELVFAVNHGLAYLVESISFLDWIYPTVLLGRLAILLGLAGLSVRIANRSARLGTLSRVVVSLAVIFTTGLVTLSVLQLVGLTTPIIAVFGIGTVVLTLLTLLLYGGVGLGTGAYPSAVGGLLLVAALAVVFVLVGQESFSTNVRGAVGEGVNAFVFLVMWFLLRSEIQPAESVEPAPSTPAE